MKATDHETEPSKYVNQHCVVDDPPPPPPPTHTHARARAHGYQEENTVIRRKPCTQCHRERTKQLFILKILFRYIGFNFGASCAFLGVYLCHFSIFSPSLQYSTRNSNTYCTQVIQQRERMLQKLTPAFFASKHSPFKIPQFCIIRQCTSDSGAAPGRSHAEYNASGWQYNATI